MKTRKKNWKFYLNKPKRKDRKYKIFLADLLKNYKLLDCNMGVKVHFSHLHLDYFPKNIGTVKRKENVLINKWNHDIKNDGRLT